MTTEIRHEIEIDAPTNAVWDVLADTGRYAEWNPFIRRLEGELRVGSKLEVEIAPPGSKAMTFTPTVLAADPGSELRWLGRLLLPLVFDGEHRFELEPLPGDRTRFVQSERFRGVLVPFLGKALRNTAAGFAAMNEALKAEVERRSTAGSRLSA